jgi:hypothetical protein
MQKTTICHAGTAPATSCQATAFSCCSTTSPPAFLIHSSLDGAGAHSTFASSRDAGIPASDVNSVLSCRASMRCANGDLLWWPTNKVVVDTILFCHTTSCISSKWILSGHRCFTLRYLKHLTYQPMRSKQVLGRVRELRTGSGCNHQQPPTQYVFRWKKWAITKVACTPTSA